MATHTLHPNIRKIMLDFLKIWILNPQIIESFKNNDLLIWITKKDYLKIDNRNFENSEEILTKEIKYYKGILFCFYPDKLEILFKPHYFFNNNLHNANDFTIVDCLKVLNEFINIFHLDPEECKIVNIEFGVNVIIKEPIEDFVSFLSYHEKNEFRTDPGLLYSKKAYKARRNGKMNSYKIIKAYAKGLHFPNYTDKNTFRFEVKSKQGAYFNRFGIYSLSDLMNFKIYNRLAEEVIKEFKSVLILYHNVNFELINDQDSSKIMKYLSNHFWFKTLQNNNRNKYNLEKKKYYKLLDKVGQNIHKEVLQLIQDKLKLCLNGAISTPQQDDNIGAISTIYKERNCTNSEVNICPITGMNISMQKEDSILLSHTGLKYYFKTDKKVFDEVKRKFLSSVWKDDDYQTQIKEIAHNIRNKSSNLKLKQDKLYPTNQFRIFTLHQKNSPNV
ncbi:hypothetical protein [Christiangramia portivictoriae]|uniref:hypothetical protein n=1 Tax=Christiangramia portivictoriae TaxID=326069 RepID=UPI0012F796F0|nr:hypothetical protein [Christiangramia portivictoriae]